MKKTAPNMNFPTPFTQAWLNPSANSAQYLICVRNTERYREMNGVEFYGVMAGKTKEERENKETPCSRA